MTRKTLYSCGREFDCAVRRISSGDAIGDTVNLASRLESATKEPGGILISEYTYNALRGIFRFCQMGSVVVTGRTEAVPTFTPEEVQGQYPTTVRDPISSGNSYRITTFAVSSGPL